MLRENFDTSNDSANCTATTPWVDFDAMVAFCSCRLSESESSDMINALIDTGVDISHPDLQGQARGRLGLHRGHSGGVRPR